MKSELAVMLAGAASPVVDATLAASSPGALLLIAGLSGLWLASKRSERWVQQPAEGPDSDPSTRAPSGPESDPASPRADLENQENPPAPR